MKKIKVRIEEYTNCWVTLKVYVDKSVRITQEWKGRNPEKREVFLSPSAGAKLIEFIKEEEL